MFDLKDKRILVTGGAGFLGKHLVQKLLERGAPRENIFVPRSAELDLRKKDNCEKAVCGREVVIHAAGKTHNAEFHRLHPAEIFFDNLIMGVELMEAARKASVEKFVTIGSATEYPDNAPLPFKEENIWLGPVEKIHAPYTIAKKMLLVQAQAYRKQYGFNAVHLLLTNMYGPGERAEGGPIPAFIKKIGEAQKNGLGFIEAWGSGKPTRDFLYVEDAAEGVVLAAEKYDGYEPLNISAGFEISIKELAKLISGLIGFSGDIKWDISKPDGVMRRLLDPSRAEKEIGFKAGTTLEDGLRKTISYHGL